MESPRQSVYFIVYSEILVTVNGFCICRDVTSSLSPRPWTTDTSPIYCRSASQSTRFIPARRALASISLISQGYITSTLLSLIFTIILTSQICIRAASRPEIPAHVLFSTFSLSHLVGLTVKSLLAGGLTVKSLLATSGYLACYENVLRHEREQSYEQSINRFNGCRSQRSLGCPCTD